MPGETELRKTLLVAKRDSVATLTLDRPPGNLIDGTLLKSLRESVETIRGDDGIRAIVITGGEDVFSEGIDGGAFKSMSSAAKREFVGMGQETLLELERIPKPTIAAMGGKVLGAGLELALCCDMRVASEDAQLGHPEVSAGLVPMFGDTYRLGRLIGRSRACSLIFYAEPIPAWEANEIGLVGKVTPREALLEEARIAVGRIASQPAKAVRAAKAAMIEGDKGGIEAALGSVAGSFHGGRRRKTG